MFCVDVTSIVSEYQIRGRQNVHAFGRCAVFGQILSSVRGAALGHTAACRIFFAPARPTLRVVGTGLLGHRLWVLTRSPTSHLRESSRRRRRTALPIAVAACRGRWEVRAHA